MKFNCEKCGTRYTIADKKVRNKVLKIRCKICEHVIVVRDPAHGAAPQEPETRPAQPLAPPVEAPADPLGPVADVEWFAAHEGDQKGPMPVERLRDLIRGGELSADDVVWNERMEDWAPVKDVPALQDALQRKRPPPPLPPARPKPPPPPPAPPPAPRAEVSLVPEPEEDDDADETVAMPMLREDLPSLVPLPELNDEPDTVMSIPDPEPIPEPEPEPVIAAAPTPTGVHADSMLRSFGVHDEQLSEGTAETTAHPVVLAPSEPEPKKRKLGLILVGLMLVGGAVAAGILLAPGDPAIERVEPMGEPSVSQGGALAATAEAKPDAAVAAPEPDAAPAVEPDAAPAAEPDAAPDAAPEPKRAAAEAKKPQPARRPSKRPEKEPVAEAEPEPEKKPARTSAFAGLDKSRKPVNVVAPSADAKGEDLPDTLNQGQIVGVIKRYQRSVRGCYDRQLKRDDSMRSGRATLAFRILPNGRTSDVGLERRFDGTVLKTCLQSVVRRWRFPRFSGKPIEVEYPLIFNATL